MKVRKLLVTDIRCSVCDAGPGEPCVRNDVYVVASDHHGARVADHAELERVGWQWQEVNEQDDGAGREERTRLRGGK